MDLNYNTGDYLYWDDMLERYLFPSLNPINQPTDRISSTNPNLAYLGLGPPKQLMRPRGVYACPASQDEKYAFNGWLRKRSDR